MKSQYQTNNSSPRYKQQAIPHHRTVRPKKHPITMYRGNLYPKREGLAETDWKQTGARYRERKQFPTPAACTLFIRARAR